MAARTTYSAAYTADLTSSADIGPAPATCALAIPQAVAPSPPHVLRRLHRRPHGLRRPDGLARPSPLRRSHMSWRLRGPRRPHRFCRPTGCGLRRPRGLCAFEAGSWSRRLFRGHSTNPSVGQAAKTSEHHVKICVDHVWDTWHESALSPFGRHTRWTISGPSPGRHNGRSEDCSGAWAYATVRAEWDLALSAQRWCAHHSIAVWDWRTLADDREGGEGFRILFAFASFVTASDMVAACCAA